jgi:8-oxo-dGTP pyrophosphatase MutT (NUDIX family)
VEEGDMSMLDFTKGKADEGETDVECAVREI